MSQGGPSHGCNGEVCEGSSASTDTGRAAERTSRLCLGRSGRWLSCCRVVGPEVGRTGSGQDGTRIAWSDQVQAQAAFGFGASGLTKPAQRCLLGYAFFFPLFFSFLPRSFFGALGGGKGDSPCVCRSVYPSSSRRVVDVAVGCRCHGVVLAVPCCSQALLTHNDRHLSQRSPARIGIIGAIQI